MTDKLPTIDIKGKQYVMVKDRIIAFHGDYPNGSIETKLISPYDSKIVVFQGIATPDVSKPDRKFIGHSQAIVGGTGVNATAAMENAETSCVGRCLGLLGIGILESVASADEIYKATSKPAYKATPKTEGRIEFLPGDELKTGNKNGKNWYGIKRGSEMIWLRQNQYEYLQDVKGDNNKTGEILEAPPEIDILPF